MWKNFATAFANMITCGSWVTFIFLQELMLLKLSLNWIWLFNDRMNYLVPKLLFLKTTNFKKYINFMYHNSLHVVDTHLHELIKGI